MKRLVIWGVGVVLFVGALWLGWSFRAGNGTRIDVDLVWLSLEQVETWRVVLAAVGTGALLAAVVVGFAWLRARLLNRRYRSVIRRLESEVHELRSLPLSDDGDSGPRGALRAAERG